MLIPPLPLLCHKFRSTFRKDTTTSVCLFQTRTRDFHRYMSWYFCVQWFKVRGCRLRSWYMSWYFCVQWFKVRGRRLRSWYMSWYCCDHWTQKYHDLYHDLNLQPLTLNHWTQKYHDIYHERLQLLVPLIEMEWSMIIKEPD
jgi:hypothetical protein